MLRLILLDRDGVLNHEVEGCVKTPEQLAMIEGAAAAVAKLNKLGMKVAVVTNQSIIGRGTITEQELHAIHEKLHKEIAKAGGTIDKLYYCPDSPENATVRRKPNPGMLLEAMAFFNIPPEQTMMIGDSETDFQAAQAAKCYFTLVLTGKGKKTLQEKKLDFSVLNRYESLAEAVNNIAGRLD